MSNEQPKAEACQTCRFWRRGRKIGDTVPFTGDCRIRAPQVFQEGSLLDKSGWSAASAETCWPKTREDDWCGQHEAGAALTSATGSTGAVS